MPLGSGGHVPCWLRADDPRSKIRACIRCRADFWSAHAGHWFCPKCAEETYRQQEKGNPRHSRFAAASIDSSRDLSKRIRLALHEARAAESSGTDSSQDLVESVLVD